MLPDRSRQIIPGFDSRHSAAEYHSTQFIAEPLSLGWIRCRPKTLGEIKELLFLASMRFNAVLNHLDQDAVRAETASFGHGANLLGYRGW